MIIPNSDGTYTVQAEVFGELVIDTFDQLFEALACDEQINMYKECEE